MEYPIGQHLSDDSNNKLKGFELPRSLLLRCIPAIESHPKVVADIADVMQTAAIPAAWEQQHFDEIADIFRCFDF